MSRRDFFSNRALGKPLRDPGRQKAWAEGVSVYDTLDFAVNRARFYKHRLGSYIVRLTIPADVAIEIEQDPPGGHHFGLYSTPETLLEFVDMEFLFVVASEE